MNRLLLVEDAPEVQAIVRRSFSPETEVTVASTLAEAREKLKAGRFDLILLDVQLPDGDGFKFCACLKKDSALGEASVIFVTSRSEIDDKIIGFGVGGEDYLIKPFHPLELRARVDAILKRHLEGKGSPKILALGRLRLNLGRLTAHVNTGRKETHLDLTPLEFKLLVYLMQNEGCVVSREQILEAVWKDNSIRLTVPSTLISAISGRSFNLASSPFNPCTAWDTG